MRERVCVSECAHSHWLCAHACIHSCVCARTHIFPDVVFCLVSFKHSYTLWEGKVNRITVSWSDRVPPVRFCRAAHLFGRAGFGSTLYIHVHMYSACVELPLKRLLMGCL